MDVSLNSKLGKQYKSNSQKARVITEDWVNNEMYCPSCNADYLQRLKHGTKGVDFECLDCKEKYQVKSQSKKFSNRIIDSAYEVMMNLIITDQAPSLLLLHYSRESWDVSNFIAIPGHLIVKSSIEKRNPLGTNARRAGWIGCNIILDQIPSSGKIYVVKDTIPRDPRFVRSEWEQLDFTKQLNPNGRGWLIDVLRCIQSIQKKRFTLDEVYHFERMLKMLHPDNMNVRPKIRQQLQMLRDKGIIRFVSRGVYEFILTS